MTRERRNAPQPASKRARNTKSKYMITQREETVYGRVLVATILFSALVLPHLMYAVIAPSKGWC